MNQHAHQVIEALGGTAKVARLFEITMPSVSDWKEFGIPKARMMYLRAKKSKLLGDIDLDAATALPRLTSKVGAKGLPNKGQPA